MKSTAYTCSEYLTIMGVGLLFCVDSTKAIYYSCSELLSAMVVGLLFCVDSTEAIYYIYLFRVVISNGGRSVVLCRLYESSCINI